MVALVQYHMAQLRRSPATGVFLAAGWVAAILLTFVQGRFIESNRADLSLFFTYLPWVIAVLVATLAMPIASERARGVTERLATLPFTPFQLISARFQVYWLLLGLWLLGFMPLVATLFYLGSPDVGPIFTGFLGSWLLAAPLLAVSLLVCLHAKSAVSGLLGSLAANFALLLVGMPQVAGWFAQVPGFGWLPAASYATLMGAYTPFTLGVINLAALLLMLAVTLLALAPEAGRKGRLICGGAGFVLLLAAMWPSFGWVQADATAESLYTPSAQTVKTLQNQGVPVTFTVHVSQNNPDVPPAVHRAVHRLTNLLLNLRAQAPGKVVVKRNNTDASLAAAIHALQAGATEQSLPSGTTYFAALEANIGGNRAVMPLIDPARQPVQEYDVMQLVEQAKANRLPQVAVVGDASSWRASLDTSFHFAPVQPLLDGLTLPTPTDVLVLAQDIPLTKPALKTVQTYLEQGGSVLLLTDAYSRAYPQPVPMDDEAPFSSLLPQWGLKLVANHIVADPTLATLVTQPKAGLMPYPFWLTLQAQQMNSNLPMTLGLRNLLLQESGVLEIEAERTVSVLPLIMSSNSAKLVDKAVFIETDPALANALVNQQAEAGRRILAAVATGAFGGDTTREGTLVVVADTDWLSPSALKLAPQNRDLLGNILHTLAGQPGLAALRAKGVAPRTLTRLEDMAAQLAMQSAKTEESLAEQLADVGPNAQEEAFTLRQKLRDIRAQTRHRLQRLENGLLAFNLLFMPFVLGCLAVGQHYRRRRLANNQAPY